MSFRCRELMLVAAIVLIAPAGHAQVLKTAPAPGTLSAGQRVLVDDGSCPKGQIKEIIGGRNVLKGSQQHEGAPRQERCIAR
jgi:Family of unknown function (DUF6719)